MSKFIESYFTTPQKKIQMKIYSHLSKNQWAVFPLPFAYIYFETKHPESHVPLLKNELSGFYISFNFLKWTYILGIYKKIKKW